VEAIVIVFVARARFNDISPAILNLIA
jgi:hypothetical protein